MKGVPAMTIHEKLALMEAMKAQNAQRVKEYMNQLTAAEADQ
jgi:hypothetical protein